MFWPWIVPPLFDIRPGAGSPHIVYGWNDSRSSPSSSLALVFLSSLRSPVAITWIFLFVKLFFLLDFDLCLVESTCLFAFSAIFFYFSEIVLSQSRHIASSPFIKNTFGYDSSRRLKPISTELDDWSGWSLHFSFFWRRQYFSLCLFALFQALLSPIEMETQQVVHQPNTEFSIQKCSLLLSEVEDS